MQLTSNLWHLCKLFWGPIVYFFFQENTTDSVQVVGAEFMDVISIKSTDGSGTCSFIAQKINVYCHLFNKEKYDADLKYFIKSLLIGIKHFG